MGSKGSPYRWTRKSSHGCTLPVQSVVVSMVYLSYMLTCILHVPVYIHMGDYINFNMLICCQCMPRTLFRIAFPTSLAIADGRTLAYTGNCPVTSPSSKGTWHTKQRIIRNVSKGPGFDSWMAIQWASRMEILSILLELLDGWAIRSIFSFPPFCDHCDNIFLLPKSATLASKLRRLCRLAKIAEIESEIPTNAENAWNSKGSQQLEFWILIQLSPGNPVT